MINLLLDKKTNKFCGMVEEFMLEMAKKSPIQSNFNVSLPWMSICWVHETILISKKFKFIKWLLDNHKIDFTKLEDNSDWYYLDTGDNYLDLVALISIQDNPIEFLISILK